MNERIQRVLDGDLPRDELTREERAALEEYQAALAITVELDEDVRARAADLPDLSEAVLARVRSPRSFTLRPALALAAAALIAFVAGLQLGEMRAGAGGPDADPGSSATGQSVERIFVHFRLDAPDAESVRLAGDFTSWEPRHELHEVAPGVWTATVALTPGVHDYAFVIDGQRWVPDPLALQVDDGFGGTNSRLSLLPPGEGASSPSASL